VQDPMAPQPEKNSDTAAFEAGSKKQFKPVGSSGTELFAGYFTEEYLQGLRGRRGAKVWDEMRRSESQVAMLMNAVKNPIKAATWEFEPALDVVGAEDHKAFIEYNAKECIDWETFLHESLTMLDFGFSLFEVIHSAVANHPKFGAFNGLKALAFRSQKTIERWNIDKPTGALKSVTQVIQGDLTPGNAMAQMVDIPAEFILLFTLQKEGDNYEGISALRPMYGAWFRKNLYLKIAGIGAEKNAIGTPIGKIPKGKQDPTQEAAFKEVLSNFTAHEASYLVVPEGWEIEIIKNDFDPSKIKELILLENTEMINSLVANFLALGTNGGGGAYALGSDLSDFFMTGIQNYANIIAGVWNRTIIPQLVKLKFGEQLAYPQLKVSNINDKAGKEMAEILSSLIGSQAVQADMKLEEYLRKAYKLPKVDELTTRKKEEPKGPFQFGESKKLSENIQLGESKSWNARWKENKELVKEAMQKGMAQMLEDYKKQITRMYKGATPSARVGLGLKLKPNSSAYEKELKELLAQISNQALAQAVKETPKAKNVKLSERIQLAAPRGGYFEALPNNIKRLVKTQAGSIAQTQSADLEKIVVFQYGSSQASTEDLDQIISDIDAAALPSVAGATKKGISVDAAAGNAVSMAVNQARMEWFFEPEVLETIESFTFYNEDPISEICNELDGTTWAVNDPDLDRYSPPLHHNCKSRLQPNEKGADGNPDINRGGTAVTQKGLDSITLCECSYRLELE
jgi:hypothetical protein